MIRNGFILFYAFLKVGLFGFGGGYAMLSLIMGESGKLSITMQQFADLSALDMVIPGPIAINAATYVGYLHSGVWGAICATIGVMTPSFVLVSLVLMFIEKYKGNQLMNGILYGIKPAAVGLIAAAALNITSSVVLLPGMGWDTLLSNPLGTVSVLSILVFVATAVANIRFSVNPILLTVLAGIVGAVLEII